MRRYPQPFATWRYGGEYSVAIPILINKVYISFDLQLAVSLTLHLKTHFELQPEDGFIKKPKHVANMIF